VEGELYRKSRRTKKKKRRKVETFRRLVELIAN
jgi:hypothetical protein